MRSIETIRDEAIAQPAGLGVGDGVGVGLGTASDGRGDGVDVGGTVEPGEGAGVAVSARSGARRNGGWGVSVVDGSIWPVDSSSRPSCRG